LWEEAKENVDAEMAARKTKSFAWNMLPGAAIDT
jgi:hypothetical protein